MWVRPALVVLAMVVAVVSGFVSVRHTGDVTEVEYENAGILYMLLLVPAMFALRSHVARPHERVHAVLVLVAALLAVVLSFFLIAMLGLGEGLGTLMTLKNLPTKISTRPHEVGAVASGLAAFVALTMVVWPAVPRRPVVDDEPAA